MIASNTTVQRDVVVVFWLDVFCLLEAGVPEFDKLYTSTPALVYKWERFPL
jgi:hypothetical protein